MNPAFTISDTLTYPLANTIALGGEYLAPEHKLLGFGIPISNLKAWNEE